jgi:predicted nucleotidyltransferase
MTTPPRILADKRADILRLAHQYGATRLRVFGSVIRGTATEHSDIDFLVAFEPDRSLLDLIGFKQDLQELLGRKVDVVSEGGLSPYLKDRILHEAQPL